MPGVKPSKIVCVGRNYGAHARELGNELPPEPLLFLKPPSALLPDGGVIRIPPGVGRVDFEGEIALVIGRRARRVPEREALGYVSRVAPANDVTARALQRGDDQWTRAKGFDTFLPLGTPVPLEAGMLDELRVETRLNGGLVQTGAVREMAFPPAFLISYISHVMTLERGDLVLTGTPSGVGPIVAGDEVEVRIPDVGEVRNRVEEL